MQISYEHTGTATSESLYIALDVPENSKEQLEIEVVVTDLNRVEYAQHEQAGAVCAGRLGFSRCV